MDHEKEKSILEEIILNRNITTLFQPIVDVVNAKIIGYEALSRGPMGSLLEMPDKLFEAAKKHNMLWDLEFLCRTCAIERAFNQQISNFLFLNVDPEIINDSKFREGLTTKVVSKLRMDPRKIIFEITEKTAIKDYSAFREALDHYLRQGYKIAIDDTGSGYSGLSMLTETKPQFIKLDMELIRDIDKDSFKQSLCRNLLSLSRITNMKLIAEGVETIDEFNTLVNIGVELVQGYFLGKPEEKLQSIPLEVKEYIANLLYEKEKAYFYTLKTYPIGKISRMDKAIDIRQRGRDVQDIFKNTKVQGVAVIDQEEPVGLIMKREINSMIANPYGNGIYLERGVDLMMDMSPLIVDYSLPISDVSQLAMSRPEDKLYDYIIISRDNKYHGVVTVKSLLENKTEIELNCARHRNPLTGLPGTIIIEYKLNHIISENRNVAILYLDINNFKIYNDNYGFENGDRVIRMTAQITTETVYKHLNDKAFVGHIGGDDFVVIMDYDSEKVEAICRGITRKFDESIRGFYNLEHLSSGYVLSADRKGKAKRFSITSLSVSAVCGQGSAFKDVHYLSEQVTKLKKECKKTDRSNHVVKLLI